MVKRYTGWNFDAVKPSNLKKIRKSAEEVKGGDTSEEEDESTRAVPTAYTSDKNLFTRDVLVDKLIIDGYQNNIHDVRFLFYLPTLMIEIYSKPRLH